MMLQDAGYKIPRHLVRSISFDVPHVEWIDGLVVVLKNAGYTRAGRSDVVRIAVLELQKVIGCRSTPDLVKFFLDRQAEHLLGPLSDTVAEPPTE